MSRILANKYRPCNFNALKGQEVLVKTVTNAIIKGKPFHAYLLTGIRGVGKTTSARIIARTLNCIDLAIENDSVVPCGKCKSCLALCDDSHPDVIEIDAASKTGVSDIRELIDNAQYAPIFGKYKIYIVDEVHMLSNSAFNALLKILEEPPANVVFIFATTECRKIPVTVISRCQKFDLHRFAISSLVCHLEEICKLEGIKCSPLGLEHIAKYSDGSMRDALSLLEAVASFKEENEIISEELVAKALGLPNVDYKYKLFEAILVSDVKQAIEILGKAYEIGCDILGIFEGLLSICNAASKVLAIKDYLQVLNLPASEKELVKTIADKSDIAGLVTIWQALFRGIQDLKQATCLFEAAEVLVIKLAYLADLPSLDKVMHGPKANKDKAEAPSKSMDQIQPQLQFKDVVDLFQKHDEMMLYYQLRSDAEVVDYSTGKIVLNISSGLPDDFAVQVAKKLRAWTGIKWLVSVKEIGQVYNTLKDQEEARLKNGSGIIKEVLQSFPGAKIESIVDVK